MLCPHCDKLTLKPLLVVENNKVVSYLCSKCKQEFYMCTGGLLLTHREFLMRKQDEQ